MTYNKTIAILGVGTLGGFVASCISNLDCLETLILQDSDIVEPKNLKNSIYRQIDIGRKKTQALSEIISQTNKDITIISISEKFIEGKTTIPKCDLILDCRDYTYDRQSIDVRLYISSRYLMVDCRKNVTYKNRITGKYLTELTKEDLRYAASLVSMLIHNNTIENLKKKESVQKYELDYVKHIDTCPYDIVYEKSHDEKFINLPENLYSIIEANKNEELKGYVGSSLFPLSEFIIPTNTLKSSKDVVLSLTRAVSNEINFNNYVLSLHSNNGRIIIELIPETGAA